MATISHDNIIWIGVISKLGGVESFAYYMAKKYKDLDIAVMCKSGDAKQLERIRQYCPAYVHRGEEVICKTIITNYDTSILDFIDYNVCKERIMVIHADYSQSCYSKYPNWHDERLTRIITITSYLQTKMRDAFNLHTELCYNPIVPETYERRLKLVSATRLSKIKGGTRMKALAEELDLLGVPYVWFVFTNDADCIHSPHVYFLPPKLDVYRDIQECDVFVQLSDTEACSYSINEALMYGKKICVTPLPYLNELPISNEKAFILDFDLKNIKDVALKLKLLQKAYKRGATNYENILNDNYDKYLAKGKSHYFKEMKNNMKKIKAKVKFRDMKHNNILRYVGEEFIEENERAEDLIKRGFATLVEDIIEKKVEVEQAVKEVKKEKAIKEKAVKKNAKK